MSKISKIHPLLFAIYPILSLWSISIEYISFSDIWKSIGVSISLMILLLLINWRLLKDWEKTLLIVSGFLFMFFSYGYVSASFKDLNLRVDPIVLIGFLLGFYLGWFGLWIWFVYKRSKDLATLNLLFFWVGVAFIGLAVFKIGSYTLSPTIVERPADLPGETLTQNLKWSATGHRPNIYYIILDGYARADVLRDLYGFDNSEFIADLQERGFFVAHRSTSNYA